MGVPEQEALLHSDVIVGSNTPQSASPAHTIPAVEKAKLLYSDFWPACLHAAEGFTDVVFERFE